jgi:DeoR family deoxyribose operon repressor
MAGLETNPAREERLRRIAHAIATSGPQRLTDAAEALGCSSMTLRRDIAAAPDRFAMLGGFVVPAATNGYRIERETDIHVSAKEAIGRRAARMLKDGDAIFIDCGATTPHLARNLPPGLRLTVVTFGLNIANILAGNRDVELILLGGLHRPSSASFEVAEPERVLSRLGLAIAFLSAGGVHATRGATCSLFHEVPVKRAAMAAAMKRCLLADASKYGEVKRAHFADLVAFEHAIVAPSPDAGAEAEAFGERLIVA